MLRKYGAIIIGIAGVLLMVGFLSSCSHLQPEKDYTTIPKGGPFAYAGLPQRPYELAADYASGEVVPLYFAGTQGVIIKPEGKIDPQRRWCWVAPMWTIVNSTYQGNMRFRYYVEPLLEKGYHVVGVDIGISCGSPAGVEVYQQYYQMLLENFNLNPKAMLVGASNGGLICYSWAFRYPQQVDRMFGIFPVTDMRSWPGLDAVISSPPEGLAYNMSSAELEARLCEFNPICNLWPLAQAGVKVFHVHGDLDNAVPLKENSLEFARQYRVLGGEIEIEVVKGKGHEASLNSMLVREGWSFYWNKNIIKGD